MHLFIRSFFSVPDTHTQHPAMHFISLCHRHSILIKLKLALLPFLRTPLEVAAQLHSPSSPFPKAT